MRFGHVSITFSAPCFLLQCFSENDPYVCQGKSQLFASEARTNHNQILTAKISVTHTSSQHHIRSKHRLQKTIPSCLFIYFTSPDRNSTDPYKGPRDCPYFFSDAAGISSYPETQRAIKPCAVSNR